MRFLLLIASLSLLPAAAAAQNVPAAEAPKVSTSPIAGVIRPGDILDLVVQPQAELSGQYPVGEDGTVVIPTVGRLEVRGLSQNEAQTLLEKEISKYFVKPKVSLGVVVFSRRHVYVSGQVRIPGLVDYKDGMTLSEVVARAGGFNSDADRRAVRVFRGEPGNRKVQIVDMDAIVAADDPAKDFVMAMGDLVEVPLRRDILFIWGEVGVPGRYDYLPDMKLHDLVARAAGLGAFPDERRVRIYHLDGSMTVVDFREVLTKDPRKDALLRPGDIVFVPNRGFARATQWVGLLSPWFTIANFILIIFLL